jgi:hypothetical protein
MEIQDEIIAIFLSYDTYNFDPASCLQQCLTLLDKYCGIDERLDPRAIKKAEEACNAYGFVSNLFLNKGYSSAATSILVLAWNKFSAIQEEAKARIYRAGIGMYLAIAYLKLGDKGASLRWALLTQADDFLGENTKPGGGTHLLNTVHGMSDTALAELGKVALDNLEKIKSEGNNDWATPYAYAEDVITKFAYNKPEYAHLFALPSSELEFPLNPTYFASLLNKVNSNALNTKEKGDRLEELATYLFLLIPGLAPRRNLLEETLAFESDIVMRNLTVSTNIFSELLGRHFLAECKNWESSVGVKDIGYFLYRMRLTHAHFGVIFAKSGITGDKDDEEKAAYSLIRKAFHEDGNICVVINNDNLASIGNTEMTFWSLLLERIERIRFGKAR